MSGGSTWTGIQLSGHDQHHDEGLHLQSKVTIQCTCRLDSSREGLDNLQLHVVTDNFISSSCCNHGSVRTQFCQLDNHGIAQLIKNVLHEVQCQITRKKIIILSFGYNVQQADS